ncbi:hypothetical protein ACET3Z_008181 [Daucus carota]
MAVETMAPVTETTEEEIDTIMNYDNLNEFLSPETPDVEEAYEDYPISSYMLNVNAYLNNINAPPTFETSADPHTSFWREPFSLENIYDIDEYVAYVDPEIGMPNLEDWFGGPFNPYYDML